MDVRNLTLHDPPAFLWPQSAIGAGYGGSGKPARRGYAAARATGGLPGLPEFRAQSQARHLPVPIRRPVANGAVRLQADAGGLPGSASLPESIRNGQRLTGMSASQASFPVVPSEVHIRAIRRVGRVGQRVAAAYREDRRPAHVRQVPEHRSHQSRSGGHLYADRRADRRASQHRRMAGSYGIGSETEDLPGLRCDDLSRLRRRRPAAIRPVMGQRVSAQPDIQGVKFRSVGDPVLYLSNPARLRRATTAARSWMRSAN